jgi:hypothetical protein
MEIHVLFCRPILDATRIILVYDDVILREAFCAGLGFGAQLWAMFLAFTNTQISFYSVQQYDQVWSAHQAGSDALICSCAVLHTICGRANERTLTSTTSLSSGHGAISPSVKYDIWRTQHLYHCLTQFSKQSWRT